jgi:hypothetical protein
MAMTESKRAFHFLNEGVRWFLEVGAPAMRCYFMRGGHIVDVEELPGLSDEEATAKAHALFLERKPLFEGFELWERTRFLIRFPRPGSDEPLGDDPGI